MRQRRFLGFLTSLALVGSGLVLAVGCGSREKETEQRTGPKVLVSFPPLYSFTKSVAGDDAHVDVLLTGTGPHSEPDPTADQLKLAKKADLFFIVGLGFDESIADKIKNAGGKSKFDVPVELGEKIEKLDPKLLREGGHHHHHDAKNEKKEEHEEEGHDPHLWLSPTHAKLMVEIIRDELKKLDPPHAIGYDSRATAYISRLDQLLKDGKAKLKDKSEKSIVTFHDSFGYFADAYGLTIAGSVQVEPGHEPSTDHLKELVRICIDKKVRVIAVEPQFNRNHAEVVKAALTNKGLKDVELVEIDPLETCNDNEISAELYEQKMRTNLQNLADKLK